MSDSDCITGIMNIVSARDAGFFLPGECGLENPLPLTGQKTRPPKIPRLLGRL